MTQAGMGSTQAINAAWLASKMEDYKRPIALAAYVMSIQLAGFPGNQLFRQEGSCPRRFVETPQVQAGTLTPHADAPRYTRGLIIAAACTIAGAVVILAWKILYRLFSNGDRGVELVDEETEEGEV